MYNLKNSLKFKLLAFSKKWTPLLTKNAPLENVTKKFGRTLPPSFGQNPKEQFFFQDNVLNILSLSSIVEYTL